LNVVVAVDKKVRTSRAIGCAGRPCDDDRIALGGAQTGFEANLLAMSHQPFGAGLEVWSMLRLGGDAGKTNVLAEFVDKA
jgi:hypothetical protein